MANALLPSSLDSASLTRRLGELAGDERNVQVDFLLHLDEFDRRRAYLDAGHGSLWDYCLRALHLREGAAGRRIGAMRVLRRFPRLEAALRDGRLCASTVSLLGQVLTDGNLEELVARAAYRTKAEVEVIVVSLRPRPAPQEGIRKLPTAAPSTQARNEQNEPAIAGGLLALVPLSAAATPTGPAHADVAPATSIAPRASPPRVEPVAEDRWSVRVTLDAEAKAELETLKALLSHKIPNGDLTAVLREAIRCGIERHGKRKGATSLAQPRRQAEVGNAKSDHGAGQPNSRHIPAAVRRDVWKRDGGRCTFVGPDGCRCDSRWQLEFDHIIPAALGGTSTVGNVRLRCRGHNMLHAERIYGRERMDQFRKPASTIAGAEDPTQVAHQIRL
jgi:5-methylcytosine-specific restriction endonuclease McrA